MPSRHSKRLGEAELEIMQILWSAQAPLTARQILQQLGDRRTWALSTLMTALARLGEKGFVRCDRSTRTNLYTPTLSAQTYQAQEGQSFLARLYGNSLPSLVASLYDSRAIGKAEPQTALVGDGLHDPLPSASHDLHGLPHHGAPGPVFLDHPGLDALAGKVQQRRQQAGCEPPPRHPLGELLVQCAGNGL